MRLHAGVAGVALFACVYGATVGTTAAAATLWTSNVGSDSATCGTSSSPCRSISQAIENATDGDTIWVGRGHYGDVNGDGNFTGPGDEQPEPYQNSEGRGILPGCIVCITKALHIYSTDGAALTVIEANASSGSNSTVMILRDGGDFGAVDHGFTITGGNTYGVTIVPEFSDKNGSVSLNMTVTGNVDIGDVTGFLMYGIDYRLNCPPGNCQFTAQILISSNRAINNQLGFDILPNMQEFSGQIVVSDNKALGAGTGFWVYPGSQTEDEGVISAGNVQLVNNIAAHGGTGFYADLPGLVTYNTALDNSQSGFTITPGGAAFQFNSAIGNGGPGVLLQVSPDVFTVGTGNVFSTFSSNNFFGNDRKRPTLFFGSGLILNGFNPGPSAHCGVLNLGPMAALYGPAQVTPVPATQLQAASNYWGSSAGPSGSGPGDYAGGVCDQNSSRTIAKPFSTTQFGSTVTSGVPENSVPTNIDALNCVQGSNHYAVVPVSNVVSSAVSPASTGSPSQCAVPATLPPTWYIKITTNGGDSWKWVSLLSLGLGN